MSANLKIGLRQKNCALKRCKNVFENNNEEMCSRFYNTVFQKIDFTGFGLHRNQPPA